MVFTSSNDVAGNQLLAYGRNADGSLTLQAMLPTGGQGSGAGLGSQGAVTLSRDGRHLFVVNAQSNTLSTFALRSKGLELMSVVDSGGLHPISVTENDGVVYVLNDQGAGNIAGFRNVGGKLRPIDGSVRGLSVAGGAAPAQVGFSEDGGALIVTEKATNTLDTYRVSRDGSASEPVVTASAGLTPFGFAFNRNNRLVVTEAAGGAQGASTVSSYRVQGRDPIRLTTVSAAVPDTQSAACWVSTTPDGRYAFVANAGSSSISSYGIAVNGRLSLIDAVAGQTGSGSAPADTAVSFDGRHLYVRNGRTFTISAFDIGDDGALSEAPFTPGLPATAVGLAAN
jgi:6-phosphogluconolactonase (cycloisomerase 2 family)